MPTLRPAGYTTICRRCGEALYVPAQRGQLERGLAEVLYLCAPFCRGCVDQLNEWWAHGPIPQRRAELGRLP